MAGVTCELKMMRRVLPSLLVLFAFIAACSGDAVPSLKSEDSQQQGRSQEPETEVELAIYLEAIDRQCEVSVDLLGTANVRWTVEGGQAPYEVWVNGDLQSGDSGVVQVACVGFGSWQRTAGGLPLTVVGTVFDSGGVRASDLLLIERPRNFAESVSNKTRAFAGGIDSLTLELFAPNICDAQEWGRYSRIPFADTGTDDISLEIEWRVSGGQAPYTVHLAGDEFEGDSGRVRLPCRHVENGVIDSGWLSIMGFAQDSAGATGSGIVQTFALARASGTPGSPEQFLNPGQIYRFEGILMTIPEGLTFDLGNDGFMSLIGECAEGSVCEPYFRLATADESVVVSFGSRTRAMYRPVRIFEGWADDPGVLVSTRSALDESIDQWEESLNKAPDLSGARWLNAAPLTISAFADPLVCDPSADPRPIDDIGFVNIIVSGGAWVPTGIEIDGEVVALARGSGRVIVRVDCSRDPGLQDLLLNVHDLGPQTETSIAKTTAEMSFLPPQSDETFMLDVYMGRDRDLWGYEPTAYCEPGGKARVGWGVYANGNVLEKPTRVRIDGMLAESQADPSQLGVDYGQHWVACQEELGLQTVLIEASDRSSPAKTARLEYLLRVVETHPSGLDWSEIRPDDYPE